MSRPATTQPAKNSGTAEVAFTVNVEAIAWVRTFLGGPAAGSQEFQEAAREGDPEKRLRILEECERYLFQEAVPMLVLCQLVQVYMYEPGELTGLSQHPRLTQYLWRMQVHKP